MNYEIIKTESGKYALFVSGKHIADYTRKSDAKRGYARYLARMERQQTAVVPQAETPLNYACRAIGQAFFLFEQINILLPAVKPQKGGVRPYTPTQRTFVRGAAGAAARSPPRLTGGVENYQQPPVKPIKPNFS